MVNSIINSNYEISQCWNKLPFKKNKTLTYNDSNHKLKFGSKVNIGQTFSNSWVSVHSDFLENQSEFNGFC